MNAPVERQAVLSAASNAQAPIAVPSSLKEFVDDGRLLSEEELRELTPAQQIAYACGTQIVASFVPIKPAE